MLRLELPASCEEIALDLHQAARSESMGLFALELFVAQNPGDAQERVLADVKRMAECLGRVGTLFRRLCPHEAQLRAFLADLDAAADDARVRSAA